MNNDLELVETNDLIHELMKRYDLGLIMLSSSQTQNADKWRSARRGDRMTLVGMMEWQKKGILEEIDERVQMEGSRIMPIGCGDPDCADCNPDEDEEDELDDDASELDFEDEE